MKSSVKKVLWTAAPIFLVAIVIGLWTKVNYVLEGAQMAHECEPNVKENTEARHNQKVFNAEVLVELKNINGNLKLLLGDRYVNDTGG